MINDLFAVQAIKVGHFSLKNDMQVPIKIDLPILLSFPKVLRALAEKMSEKVSHFQVPLFCGVPYVGLALATLVGVEKEIPVITHRMERKNKPGTPQIEGVFKSGQKCAVMADLTEPGAELFNTLDALEEEGLEVKDVFVAVDWNMGSKEKLRARGAQLHALMTVQEMVDSLADGGKIGGAAHKLITDFFDSQ